MSLNKLPIRRQARDSARQRLEPFLAPSGPILLVDGRAAGPQRARGSEKAGVLRRPAARHGPGQLQPGLASAGRPRPVASQCKAGAGRRQHASRWPVTSQCHQCEVTPQQCKQLQVHGPRATRPAGPSRPLASTRPGQHHIAMRPQHAKGRSAD